MQILIPNDVLLHFLNWGSKQNNTLYLFLTIGSPKNEIPKKFISSQQKNYGKKSKFALHFRCPQDVPNT